MAGGDVWCFFEVAFAFGEGCCDVVAHFQFGWIVADDEGASEVCFVLFEDGAEVDEEDVVAGERVVRWIVRVGEECVGSGADDALVPVGGDAEEFFSEVVDGLVELAFGDAGADESACFYLVEEFDGVVLCAQEFGGALLFGDGAL